MVAIGARRRGSIPRTMHAPLGVFGSNGDTTGILKGESMRTRKTVARTNGTIIETTTIEEEYPAVIDYEDILDACEIVPDDDMGPPWKEQCGWDHDTEDVDYESGRRDANNYSYERDLLIEPTDPDYLETYDRCRADGMSKQVAREMMALVRRERVKQLVAWYNHGYEWYGVTCDFMGRHASCWGIGEYDYARKEVRKEIAGEIVAQLEDDSYTVEDQPAWRTDCKLDRHRDRLKRNLKLDCWTD